jgi:hypothetical protein
MGTPPAPGRNVFPIHEAAPAAAQAKKPRFEEKPHLVALCTHEDARLNFLYHFSLKKKK